MVPWAGSSDANLGLNHKDHKAHKGDIYVWEKLCDFVYFVVDPQ